MSGVRRAEQISVARGLVDRLLEQARAAQREEVCGLIGGYNQKLLRAYPVVNIAFDRRRWFELCPRGQIDAMRRMRAAGETFLAIYHSHPVGPAYPSPADLQHHAYPEQAYLIIALSQPGAMQLRAFHIRDSQARELALVVV